MTRCLPILGRWSCIVNSRLSSRVQNEVAASLRSQSRFLATEASTSVRNVVGLGCVKEADKVQKLQASLSDPTLFRQNAYVNGEWTFSLTGKTFSITNPATGEMIGTCPEMFVSMILVNVQF
jgi:hypothetical protein